MSFGSPVPDASGKPAPILENKAPWPGPPTFRVTSTFAQHIASGRGAGIDIGNGRCNDPVLAMADGVVTFVGQLSTAIGLANVVRYRISATEELGAAHLATMTVINGQRVKRGDQIGTLGMTGADACHLHQGYKVNGVEADWWPLYTAQEESMGYGTKQAGKPIGSFTFHQGQPQLINALDTSIRYPQPSGAGPFAVVAALDLKDANGKSIDIDGNSPALTNRDQVYLLDMPAFDYAGYALRQDGDFTATTVDDKVAFNAGVAAGAQKALEAKK